MSSDPVSASGAQQFSAKPDDKVQHESENSQTEPPFASPKAEPHDPSPDEEFGHSNSAPTNDDAIFGGILTGSVLFADMPRIAESSGRAPSLPIILISAACAIAGGIIGLYISYAMLGLGIVLSTGLGTLGLLFGLGVSGAALSAATGERGAVTNMVFSCTLVILMVLFMTLCAVVGAAVATVLVKI